MKMLKYGLFFGVLFPATIMQAETLTYSGVATGSFYDGSYWGGTVPSETSDILFNQKAKELKYTIDAKNGVTINSLTDESITNRAGASPWGKNIEININNSKFTILNDITFASNHNFVPFLFKTNAAGTGEIVVGGNIISKLASDGTSGESLFGDGSLIKSVSVAKNIELQNSRLRFHTLNLTVTGKLNFTGGELNLFYGSGTSQSIAYSFGGIVGSGKKLQIGGNESNAHLLKDSTETIILTNSDTSKFNGSFTYIANVVENNTLNLVMAGTTSGVQYFENTGTIAFNNISVKSGKLNYYSAAATSALSVLGGKLSAATTSSEISTLNAASLAWSGGTLSFDIVEDTAASDKIKLTGNLTKAVLLGAPSREIELVAKADDILSWIEASESKSLTYTLMEYASGSTITNSDVIIAAIDGVKIDYNFGNTALTVTLTKVPEPATFSALFGVIALGFVAYRQKAKRIR